MNRHKLLQSAAALLLSAALALSGVPPTFAAPPTNDNFASAALVSATPFSDSVDNTEATVENGEPGACNWPYRSLWYSFTPSVTGFVRAGLSNSPYGAFIVVYQDTGAGLGGLAFVGCAPYYNTPPSVVFNAQAGTTYYVQVAHAWDSPGTLTFQLNSVPPPANDNFGEAASISALPFSGAVDTVAATREAGEPVALCESNPQSGTAWYAFTPAASGSISASVFNAPFSTFVAAYTGSSLNSLSPVGCRNYGRLTFRAEAGVTYYFQVGGLYGQGGPLTFTLEVAPAPVANFGFSPGDPSVFDTLQFYDFSYDPGEVGIQSQAWNFGDGATATGCCPTHRYAADGDYTVQHTVTTFDGRRASASQVVQVRTHDVAITKLTVPKTARSGVTREISVAVRNTRYPETVQVQLFKSVPGASGTFVLVGTLTLYVPVRSANQTTPFVFSYTFTSEDANMGKVTFKAVATIVNARDALPADNEAVAPPTRVSR